MYTFGVVGETHAWLLRSDITFSDMSLLVYYVMCNLHIKETEVSRKRSKGIKN